VVGGRGAVWAAVLERAAKPVHSSPTAGMVNIERARVCGDRLVMVIMVSKRAWGLRLPN
jgi:hypothetical protein